MVAIAGLWVGVPPPLACASPTAFTAGVLKGFNGVKVKTAATPAAARARFLGLFMVGS